MAVQAAAPSGRPRSERYRLRVSKAEEERAAFGRYVAAAIEAAGYDTPTAFARAAKLEPSAVLRWINGQTRPSIATIRKVAPLLRMTSGELAAIAFPQGSEESALPPPKPIPREVAHLLAALDDLDGDARAKILQQAHWLAELAEMLADQQRQGRARRVDVVDVPDMPKQGKKRPPLPLDRMGKRPTR